MLPIVDVRRTVRKTTEDVNDCDVGKKGVKFFHICGPINGVAYVQIREWSWVGEATKHFFMVQNIVV